MVKGIPPQAVLKPSHASFKLQEQHFSLGDRVVMVQDAGSVPLGAKGIVVGFHHRVMEVLWDHSFISGTNLGGRCVSSCINKPLSYQLLLRCSPYRGLEVPFESCLNLANPQYVINSQAKSRQAGKAFFNLVMVERLLISLSFCLCFSSMHTAQHRGMIPIMNQ
jgi:hypothetical protein